jgi:N utilization substance protein A
MRNEFEVAFNEIAELRALPAEVVLEALQTALISAYRRDAGASAAQKVDAKIDPGNGRARIFVEKEVVEDVQSPNTEVDLEKARYYDPEANLGDTVMVQVEGTTKKFGRIAAQTAKQVILQKIREAERNALFDEFKEKEGDIINATVQSVNASMVTLSLGRAEAVLPRAQQIPGERYRPHEKIRVYLMDVKRSSRGPQILVSRSHRNMLRRLLEYEVPEIYNGQVEIKSIAREAGYRSKVAVAALQDGIDPVGACVGMRGIRIQNIVKELHDEKIDIIEWSPDQESYIAKALSPARVTGVYLDDDPDSGRTAIVIVPDEDLSLAIGREGQNARLAAKLTGWRIDIKSVAEAVTYALDHLETQALATLKDTHAEMLEEVQFVMEKKANGLTVMPEEYRTLGHFADLSEKRLLALRLDARKARMAEINAVKATLPQAAFRIPISALDLPDNIIEALEPLETVGEIMLRFLIDEERLRRLLGKQPDEALAQVQEALDKVVTPEDYDVMAGMVEEEEEEAEVETAEAGETEAVLATADAVNDGEVEVAEGEAEEAEPAPVPAEDLVALPEVPLETEEESRKRKAAREREEVVVDEEFVEDEDLEELLEDGTKKSTTKRKKEKQKRRQLIFDEELGETVARRRRKGSRSRGNEWDV